MRKRLDTRFPASRIKKIMQTDEDVGKIALAVPLLVYLCDKTYDITLKRGAKTMISSHLKQCVHKFSIFDFLKETVSRVPDVGFSDAGGEDRSSKRRKAVDDDGNVSDDEPKRSKREMVHNSRGPGRGRGRGRGRASHGTELDISRSSKCEDGPETCPQYHDKLEQGVNKFSRTELKENGSSCTRVAVRDFDLNLELDENGFATESSEMKLEEYNMWPPLSYVDKMTIDPLQPAVLDKRIEEEEEEDYDNED
ncbi:dr1-associated corepressor-like isoform X2 [Phalaenopsis equestris]|uniref:dr1-associated corepressor-like isoform X2 n=1 Tax=Phalaenopsis equestris TaxID=78828 RepID=UPI0009E5ACA9|nr:dr1-associated corepressor-like isoform X2 [Phalaenopsis equestris]